MTTYLHLLTGILALSLLVALNLQPAAEEVLNPSDVPIPVEPGVYIPGTPQLISSAGYETWQPRVVGGREPQVVLYCEHDTSPWALALLSDSHWDELVRDVLGRPSWDAQLRWRSRLRDSRVLVHSAENDWQVEAA
jgi:hypothetical protein